MRTLKTYTFRVPDNLRRDLDSPAMRVWLADFLAQPRALPPDPGAGEDRVSLTLPTQLVAAVARILRCSSSSALRRVAVDRSGAPAKAATTERDSSETWQRKPEARATVRNSRTPMPPQTPAKSRQPAGKGGSSQTNAAPCRTPLSQLSTQPDRGPSPETKAILLRADCSLGPDIQALLFKPTAENRWRPMFPEMGGGAVRNAISPREQAAYDTLMKARSREMQAEKDKSRSRIGASY